MRPTDLLTSLSDHPCDRKGPPVKVIDESGDEPITSTTAYVLRHGGPQQRRVSMPAKRTTHPSSKGTKLYAGS